MQVASANDQLAAHLAAAFVLREIAVEGESAGLIRAELEDDSLAGGGALRDAVGVHRETVGDVPRAEGDFDDFVFLDLDPGRGEGVVIAVDETSRTCPGARADRRSGTR